MTDNTNSIFDLINEPAPSPAEEVGKSSFENVIKNKDGFSSLEEEIKAERAKEAPAAETTPAVDEKSADTEATPELSIVEATEEAKVDATILTSDEVKAGNGKTVHIPTYEELKKSEMYMPIVNLEQLNSNQLARAAQNKLAGDMDVRTFLYCWIHFAFCENAEYAKQFLVKSKSLDSGIEYIKSKLKNTGSGSVGIGEGKVIELFLEYLSLDDAQIAAEKAKAEAERKAQAEAAKAKRKEKSKKKTESKPATSAKAKSNTKADDKKETVKKPSPKKATAPKAATSDSVMSLFSMM